MFAEDAQVKGPSRTGTAVGELLGRLSKRLVDVVYPPRCLLCHAMDEAFCSSCRALLPEAPVAPVPEGILEALAVAEHDGPARDAVHRLKFGRQSILAEPMGEMMAGALVRAHFWSYDALVPVPLHWVRHLSRGYNQSQLLAEEVSRRLGVPVVCALARRRYTRSQVGLPAEERRRRIMGAFGTTRSVVGRRLVLIDDVLTTGGTVTAAAEALRAAGAAAVYALTFTRAGAPSAGHASADPPAPP